MTIRPFKTEDVPHILSLWNASSLSGETLYSPLTESAFQTRFLSDPNYDGRFSLVAEEDGAIIGFISGVAKKIFLHGETNENTPGFLTCLFVEKTKRNNGVGSRLLNALETAFSALGKSRIACHDGNPVNISWLIPGTPGHDHNNAPGVDTLCPGYAFFLRRGFKEKVREVAMYLNLEDYTPWPELHSVQESLKNEGIQTGRYDPRLHYNFTDLCDHVGSAYWRAVLETETACHLENRPNTDTRFMPDGIPPQGPRPILAATFQNKIVAFTGPVDKQQSGRGWFTGICTDPAFERKGIASVLFNLLMQEFIREGAQFSSIFTGESNHAQKIYLRTGFRPVRTFAQMEKAIGG